MSTEFELDEHEKNDLVDIIRNNFGADISEIMHISKKTKDNLLCYFNNIYYTYSNFLFFINKNIGVIYSCTRMDSIR